MIRYLMCILFVCLETSGAFAQNALTIVATNAAPKAIGPYSQAVIVRNTVYVSGQLGMDPETGRFPEGGITAQTEQSLKNMAAVLKAASSSLDHVVSCTVYMKDLNDFAEMNEIYARFFPNNPPARATVQVARIPKDGLVEISCIAVLP